MVWLILTSGQNGPAECIFAVDWRHVRSDVHECMPAGELLRAQECLRKYCNAAHAEVLGPAGMCATAPQIQNSHVHPWILLIIIWLSRYLANWQHLDISRSCKILIYLDVAIAVAVMCRYADICRCWQLNWCMALLRKCRLITLHLTLINDRCSWLISVELEDV